MSLESDVVVVVSVHIYGCRENLHGVDLYKVTATTTATLI
jgi:hypothetical protein